MRTTANCGNVKRISAVTEFQRSWKDRDTKSRNLGWTGWQVWLDIGPAVSKAVQADTSVPCKSAQCLPRAIVSTRCRRRGIQFRRRATATGRRTASQPESGTSLSGRVDPASTAATTKCHRSRSLSRTNVGRRLQARWPFWCRNSRESSSQGASQTFLATSTSIRRWVWPGQPGRIRHQRRGYQLCRQLALV